MFKFKPFNEMWENRINNITDFYLNNNTSNYTFTDIAEQVSGHLKVMQTATGEYAGTFYFEGESFEFYTSEQNKVIHYTDSEETIMEYCTVEHYCGMTAIKSEHLELAVLDSLITIEPFLDVFVIEENCKHNTPLFKHMNTLLMRDASKVADITDAFRATYGDDALASLLLLRKILNKSVTVKIANGKVDVYPAGSDTPLCTNDSMYTVFGNNGEMIHQGIFHRQQSNPLPMVERYFGFTSICQDNGDALIWYDKYAEMIPGEEE